MLSTTVIMLLSVITMSTMEIIDHYVDNKHEQVVAEVSNWWPINDPSVYQQRKVLVLGHVT